MSLYTLPFAEPILIEDDAPIDPWINDLYEFPPLSTTTPPLTTRSHSSSSSSSCSEWDMISMEQENEDWVDLCTDMRPTFADVAEAAGVYHEPIPTTTQHSLIRFRWSYGSFKHHHHHKQADSQDFNQDNDHDSLLNDLYDDHKSQARNANRRTPYIQRHRQKVQEVVLRRDLRSLPQVHEKYNRRLTKAENAIATTCAKREIAHNNWRSALVLENPSKIQQEDSAFPSSIDHPLPPRATVQAPYTHVIVQRRRKRRCRTVYTQTTKVPTDLPAEYKTFYRVLVQELLQRQLAPSSDDDDGDDGSDIIDAILKQPLGWHFGAWDSYNNKAFAYHEMKKILASDLRTWHISYFTFEKCNVSFEEYLEYMRKINRIVKEEFKPNANIGFYPSRWMSCSRILSILYLQDIFEMNHERRRLEHVLDDINKNDALKTLYKAISKNGSKHASSRDKQLRKHLIKHFLEQWTSCK